MNKHPAGFWRGRIRGSKFAAKGAWMLIRTEPSIQVQVGLAVIVTMMGVYFDISKTEWLAQLLAIGLVMSVEGMNTAVEAMADFIHPEYHPKIGAIKDVAAGAVFIAAIIATIIGFYIYIPYILMEFV